MNIPDLDYTPFRVSQNIYIRGQNIRSCGIDRDFSMANIKAVSELHERLYTSDIMNTDVTGLVTYLQPNLWCSTGAACHVDLDACIEKSKCELIERDSISSWLSFGGPAGKLLWMKGERQIIRIPCRFKNYVVIVCVRTQNDRQGIFGGASLCPECAIRSAYEESFLREHLNDEFLASRLPQIPCSADAEITYGQDELPASTQIRYWQVGDRHITKMYSPDLSDFYRGMTTHTIDRYREYIGNPEAPWKKVKKSWLF